MEPIPRTIEALPDGLVAALDTIGSPVERIETHISHLALTEGRVYKLRKAVAFDFVDFGRRETRMRDCWNEVLLNRRLAPRVYLGVAPFEPYENGFRVGEIVDPARMPVETAERDCEWVVVMRRLPTGRDAESLWHRGDLAEEHVDRLAEHLARFHRDSRSDRGSGDPTDTVRTVLRSIRSLEGAARSDASARLAWLVREFEMLHGKLFAERRAEGRWVDGHGDLRLEHVWFDDAKEPEIIDCVEFSEDLRLVDAANEVAFLSMDLRFRGAHALAERFLASYAAAADDFGIYSVLRYYEAYRAAVRAKVSALRNEGTPEAERQRDRYLGLATRLLSAPGQGLVIATTGHIGSGKSSIAAELARRLPAVVIRSDVVRKQLAGVEPTTSLATSWGEGNYSLDQRSKIYDALFARAEAPLNSGRHVILDASFGRRSWRDALAAWAASHRFTAWIVHAECPPSVVRQRLILRSREGRSASDAGPELLDPSRAAYEAPTEWRSDRLRSVDTGRSDWRGAGVASLAADLLAARLCS